MVNRVSNDQLEELLEFLSEHPSLAKGIGLGVRSKEAVDKQWNDLAVKLNAFGSGSSKTGERWKKYWADIKHKAKARLARRRQNALGTGGGPCNQEAISEIDNKILSIMGEQAVYGDIQYKVPIFITQPEGPVCDPMEQRTFTIPELITETIDLSAPVASSSSVDPHMQYETQVVSPNLPVPECPKSGFIKRKRRLRHNRSSMTINSGSKTRFKAEWVMELESSRIETENKIANAMFLIAEAANKIADAAVMDAEISRQQLELLNKIVAAMGQLTDVLAARKSLD